MAAPKEVVRWGAKDPRIQTIAPTLLKRSGFIVRHDGDLVTVKFKDATIRMDYPTAIKLSQMLYAHGKQAKKFAGDYSKKIETLAVLTDAEQHERLNFR